MVQETVNAARKSDMEKKNSVEGITTSAGRVKRYEIRNRKDRMNVEEIEAISSNPFSLLFGKKFRLSFMLCSVAQSIRMHVIKYDYNMAQLTFQILQQIILEDQHPTTPVQLYCPCLHIHTQNSHREMT